MRHEKKQKNCYISILLNLLACQVTVKEQPIHNLPVKLAIYPHGIITVLSLNPIFVFILLCFRQLTLNTDHLQEYFFHTTPTSRIFSAVFALALRFAENKA